MTDLILQSNNTSAILRSLASGEVQDYSYSISPGAPLLAKKYIQIQPKQAVNGVPASQEVSFALNKADLLRDLQIQTIYTISATTNEVATNAVGLQLYQYYEFRSLNKVIFRADDSYILARTHQCSAEKMTAIYRRAVPLSATTGDGATVASDTTKMVYTPIFCPFFEDVKNNYDLGFWEQMELVLRFNTTTRAGLAQALVTATPTLWVWTDRPSAEYYDMLRSKNNNPAAPLSMLTYSTFRESTVCTGTTSTSIRLNCTFPAFNTYFYLRDNTGTVSTASAWINPINSFDFSVGGTVLLQSVPKLVGNWESESNGSGCGIVCLGVTATAPTTVTKLANTVMALNWGLDINDRTTNTGSVSFNQLNNPTLTVYYSSLTAANFDIIVVHEYWTILKLDASNSAVEIVQSV